MFPGTHVGETPDTPAFVMAGPRGGRDLPRARRGQPASPPVPHAGLRRGDHIACCLENNPRFHEVGWGADCAGPLLHGHQLPAHPRRGGVHRHRLRGRAFITTTAQARPAAELVGRDAGRRGAPHHRRRRRPATSPTRTAVAGLPDHADRRTGRGGSTCSTARAPRAPEGRRGDAARRPGRPPSRCHRSSVSSSSASNRRWCTSRPPPCTTRPRCASHGGPAGRRHRGGDGALRPRRVPRAHRAPPGDPHAGRAHHVRPPAQAARGRAHGATTCRASGSASTPPRPARWP